MTGNPGVRPRSKPPDLSYARTTSFWLDTGFVSDGFPVVDIGTGNSTGKLRNHCYPVQPLPEQYVAKQILPAFLGSLRLIICHYSRFVATFEKDVLQQSIWKVIRSSPS